MALNPAHKNPGADGWTLAESVKRLAGHYAARTDGDDPYRDNAEVEWDGDLFDQDVKAVLASAAVLEAMTASLAERVAEQSELLSERAGKREAA